MVLNRVIEIVKKGEVKGSMVNDVERALYILGINRFGLVEEKMRKTERLPRNEEIKELKEKRTVLYHKYNGILAGVIKGDESDVGMKIHKLNEQLHLLQALRL